METLFVALRVLLSLGAVLALMWWLQRRFSRGGVGAKVRSRVAGSLAVVGRQSVGPKASVVVLEHDGHRFLLGVTEHGVNVLHTTEMAPDAGDASLDASAPRVAESSHSAANADSFALFLAGQPEFEQEPHTSEPDGRPMPERAPELVTSTSTSTSTSTNSSTVAPPAGKLSGSILAPETWKQAAAFVRNSR